MRSKAIIFWGALLLNIGLAQDPDNNLQGPGNLVISGKRNDILGAFNAASGFDNVLRGNLNYAEGDRDIVLGNKNKVFGSDTIITGHSNRVEGD